MEYVKHNLKVLIDQLKERGKKFTTGQINFEKGKIPPQPQEPSPTLPDLEDHTKELYKQLNFDPAKVKKARGSFNLTFNVKR